MSREVPEGWRWVRLGEVAHEDRGRNADGKIPSERLVGVFKNDGMIPMRERVKGVSFDRCKIVQPGAFAYNPMRINIGSIARSSHGDTVMVSPDYVVFSANEQMLDGSYLEHLRRSAEWDAYVGNAGDGGVRIRIYFDHLAEFRFALPPLHEQRRIAEILSSVDEAIAATRAVIEQTRKVKQGVLERLLTKGIGHTRFKQTEIGEIPEGWEVAELIDVSEAVTVGIASSATHAYRSNGIPMLRNQNIKAGVLDLSELLFVSPEYDTENASKRVKAGDVVSMRTGYPGRSAVIPPELDGCQTFTTLVTKPRQDLLNSDFLCAWINSNGGMKQVRRLQAGGAQQNLNAGVLKKLLVPLPLLPEQKQIALSAKALLFDEEQGISALNELKSAIMSDLLTGRKRVTDAFPMAAE